MSSESVSVSGPVEIKPGSAESTAFELMKHISSWEDGKDDQKRNRSYWLTLYRQCYKATNGNLLASILKEE